jgi:hypothetical protein
MDRAANSGGFIMKELYARLFKMEYFVFDGTVYMSESAVRFAVNAHAAAEGCMRYWWSAEYGWVGQWHDIYPKKR